MLPVLAVFGPSVLLILKCSEYLGRQYSNPLGTRSTKNTRYSEYTRTIEYARSICASLLSFTDLDLHRMNDVRLPRSSNNTRRASRRRETAGRVFHHVDNLPQRLPKDGALQVHGRLRLGLHAAERADAHDAGATAPHSRQVKCSLYCVGGDDMQYVESECCFVSLSAVVVCTAWPHFDYMVDSALKLLGTVVFREFSRQVGVRVRV